MAESKGHDLVNTSQNSLKSKSGHLDILIQTCMQNIRILAQWVLKISCWIMVELKKEHNLVNISLNSFKSLSGRLNIDPNPYVKFQHHTSSGFQGIV